MELWMGSEQPWKAIYMIFRIWKGQRYTSTPPKRCMHGGTNTLSLHVFPSVPNVCVGVGLFSIGNVQMKLNLQISGVGRVSGALCTAHCCSVNARDLCLLLLKVEWGQSGV